MHEEKNQFWTVVGGADKGGIIVREDKEVNSNQLSDRLTTGSLVEERRLVGERLSYKLVEGAGPTTGWVSVKLKDKDLLVKETAEVPQLFASLPVVEPLPRSTWLPMYKRCCTARCRLFCAFGAGTDATVFSHWYKIFEAKYPALEVVLVQLPGRGANRRIPLQCDANELAKLFIEELMQNPSMFALFGFSIGATWMYAAAMQLAQKGHMPLGVYIVGRAGVQIQYKDIAEDMQKTPEDYLRWFVRSFANTEAVKKTDMLIEAGHGEMLIPIMDMQRQDLLLGNSLASMKAPVEFPCNIHVLASTADRVWPARDSDENCKSCIPAYESIVESWRLWTTGKVSSTIFDEIPHDRLCGNAVLKVVCDDLQRILSELAAGEGSQNL